MLSRPDIKTAWEKLGAEPMIMTRAEYAAHIDNEIAKWAKVIKTNNIQSN
jgi:tripartite-type tricarboxylate transporter receptor subunit TctC